MTGWIPVRFVKDIYIPLGMNCSNLDGPLSSTCSFTHNNNHSLSAFGAY